MWNLYIRNHNYVLLILAGVSIATLIGDNGILNQAKKSVDNTNIESAKEQIVMELLASYDETGKIDMDVLKLNLKNNLGIDISNIGNELPCSNIVLNDYEFSITQNGEVVYGNLLSTIINSNDYGDYINYPIDLNNNGDTTDDWRIFYNDGTRVFIIAANYVPSDSKYLDLATAEIYRYSNTDTSYKYTVNWYNSITSNITLSKHLGNLSINREIANIFMYKKYYIENINLTNVNVKAVSSLLDTNAWDGLVDIAYADYAVGGSTIEMWVASWNEKYTPLYVQTGTYGYYVGLQENPITGYQNVKDIDGYKDILYFPYNSSLDNNNSYWLASPGSYGDNSIMCVSYDGNIGAGNYNRATIGLRPVVALRTTTIAAKNSNEEWELLK